MILSTFCAATSRCHCSDNARIVCSSFVWPDAADASTASPIAASDVNAENRGVYLISPPPLIGVLGWGIDSLLHDQRLKQLLDACMRVEADCTRGGNGRRHRHFCDPEILLGAFDPHLQPFARLLAYASRGEPRRTLWHRARREEQHSLLRYEPIEEARVVLAPLVV